MVMMVSPADTSPTKNKVIRPLRQWPKTLCTGVRYLNTPALRQSLIER